MSSIFQLLIIVAIAVATVFSLRNGSTAPLNCKGVLSTIHKDLVSLLALISLATTFLGELSWFLFYNYDWWYDSDYNYYSYLYFDVRFDLNSILSFLLALAPIVLLCMYFLMKQSNKNAYRLVILAIASKALIALTFNGNNYLLYGIECIVQAFYYITQIFDIGSFNDIRYCLSDIFEGLAIIATVVVALFAFLGKAKHKMFRYILIVCLTSVVLGLLEFFIGNIPYYMEEELYFCLFTAPCYYIGEALFLVVLWLFVTKNELPRFYNKNGLPRNNPKEITPEMQLIALKDKLELGIINEEEYKAQRADIISKL